MAEKRFEFATKPHVAEVGEWTFRFPAELSSKELLAPYKELVDAYGADPENLDPADVDRTRKVMDALLKVVRTLMVPEDRETFDEAVIPDRTVGEMFRWVMELYGQRPTTPSSDSSSSPSNNGDVSTENLQSKEEQTLSIGAPQDS